MTGKHMTPVLQVLHHGLVRLGAGQGDVAAFVAAWPNDAEVTAENVLRACHLDPDAAPAYQRSLAPAIAAALRVVCGRREREAQDGR